MRSPSWLRCGVKVAVLTAGASMSSASAERGVLGIDASDMKRRVLVKSVESAADRMSLNRPLRIRHPLLEGGWENEGESVPQKGHRGLETPCDAAFLSCLPNEKCLTCFEQLGSQDINWAGIQSATPCPTIVSMLNDAGHCMSLKGDGAEEKLAASLFCDTFNSCVLWDDVAHEDDDDAFDAEDVDCDELTSCDWRGIHDSFLGDGICQKYGCYNHAICDYDKGDCCEDSCNSGIYAECGVDGFACIDPTSEACDSTRTSKCKAAETSAAPTQSPQCSGVDKMYDLREYDSWGDGWDQTQLNITDNATNMTVYAGRLNDGYEGSSSVCLHTGCYTASTSGGIWGVEVSWDLRLKGGAVLASGGSPMTCTFPIGGSQCENTCVGKPPDGTEKFISECINSKCVLQLGACDADENGCKECLGSESPTYCFTNDAYNAVVDCAVCQCMDEPPKYCQTLRPAKAKATNVCTAPEILEGSASVIAFSKCTDIDGMNTMMSDWDNDMFGTLDDFEKCAHTFSNSKGKPRDSALDCMGLLYDIVNGETDDPDYVVKLATTIYEKSESSCDCFSGINKSAPSCASFFRFKTYLYETLDACTALDEIDCAAWEDFAAPCKKNLEEKFELVDFGQDEQCQYVHSQCGGVGAFPAFRRLDCGKEITRASWSFYSDFSKQCLKDSPGPEPKPSPNDTPSEPPTKSPTSKNDKPAEPTEPSPAASPTPKPYVPPKGKDPLDGKTTGSSTKASSASTSSKMGRFLLWVFALGAVGSGGYMYYKRRFPSFDFVRYQRQREWMGDDDEDDLDTELFASSYTGGNASEENMGSFEPPSITINRMS